MIGRDMRQAAIERELHREREAIKARTRSADVRIARLLRNLERLDDEQRARSIARKARAKVLALCKEHHCRISGHDYVEKYGEIVIFAPEGSRFDGTDCHYHKAAFGPPGSWCGSSKTDAWVDLLERFGGGLIKCKKGDHCGCDIAFGAKEAVA